MKLILFVSYLISISLHADVIASSGDIKVLKSEVEIRLNKWFNKVLPNSTDADKNKHRYALCNMLLNRRIILSSIPKSFKDQFLKLNNYSIKDYKQIMGQDVYDRSSKLFLLSDNIILKDFIDERMMTEWFTIKYEKTITDHSVFEFYEKEKDKYFTNTKLDYSQIYISSGSPKDKSMKRKIADQLHKGLNGSNFADYAKKYSECQMTKKDGGQLKNMNLGKLPGLLRAELLKLKEGDISPITLIDGDYFIFKLDKISKEVIDFEKIKLKLKSRLLKAKIDKEILIFLSIFKRTNKEYIFCNQNGELNK